VSEEHITYTSQKAEMSNTRGFQRKVISLIILLYFGIVTIQCLPNSPARDRLKAYVDPVIMLLGLKQRWNLFSPDIRLLNQYATTEITFRDGAVKLYEWPENRKFSFSEGIRRNQLRKFVIDGLNEPNYKFFWPATSRFIALCNSNPDNPPVLVQPVFNGFDIPRFAMFAKQDELNLRAFNHRTPNAIFRVREKDLQQGLR
jgi:hypothetical protein